MLYLSLDRPETMEKSNKERSLNKQQHSLISNVTWPNICECHISNNKYIKRADAFIIIIITTTYFYT